MAIILKKKYQFKSNSSSRSICCYSKKVWKHNVSPTKTTFWKSFQTNKNKTKKYVQEPLLLDLVPTSSYLSLLLDKFFNPNKCFTCFECCFKVSGVPLSFLLFDALGDFALFSSARRADRLGGDPFCSSSCSLILDNLFLKGECASSFSFSAFNFKREDRRGEGLGVGDLMRLGIL